MYKILWGFLKEDGHEHGHDLPVTNEYEFAEVPTIKLSNASMQIDYFKYFW